MSSDGWTFEGPDPEVGIFGELVIHECGTEEEAVEGPTQMHDTPDGKSVRVVRTFRCPGCGAETEVVESEPKEWFE